MELDQITSILANICIIVYSIWFAYKYFQIEMFLKNIIYNILKMTHLDQVPDQIDQLLLQASQQEYDGNTMFLTQTGDNKMKEKLIQVVASGKSRQYLGKAFNTKEIEELNQEQIQKLYARYEAVLGGLITKQLKLHMCIAYSRAVKFICPTLNFELDDIKGLANSLSEGPFIDLALSSLTCKLYHEYGHFLAPLEAAIITSSHLSRTSSSAVDQLHEASQEQLQDDLLTSC